MTKKNVHVTPNKSEKTWDVKTEGNQRPISTHDTQKKAIEEGRKIAIKNKSELSIHNREGKNTRKK